MAVCAVPSTVTESSASSSAFADRATVFASWRLTVGSVLRIDTGATWSDSLRAAASTAESTSPGSMASPDLPEEAVKPPLPSFQVTVGSTT